MEMVVPGVTSQVELTGAEITIRCLQEEKVPFVFGYPGGAILPIYDEMFKQDKVKHILVRHEQAAVHGAEGFSRATGAVGVVMVTSMAVTPPSRTASAACSNWSELFARMIAITPPSTIRCIMPSFI